VRDGAVVYDEIESAADLPAGRGTDQDSGRYRLTQRGDGALFAYAVGPSSWKRFLFPPRRRLFRATGSGSGALCFTVGDDEGPAPRYALIGVRACELAALAIHDRVLLEGPWADPAYAARRNSAFVLAVECGEAGGTCFCASMGTGPGVVAGYDLKLTEVVADGAHYFTAEAGSERGAEVLAEVDHRPATAAERAAAQEVVARAAEAMGRSLDTRGLAEALAAAYESPRWEAVAQRCLACGNCTLVCPTCFCTTVEDTTALSGDAAERWRRWDTCFATELAYLHGGSVRPSVRSRYRQWLMHKLSTWHDQFGTSGCVGCGRCITWCPVGIDITEEAEAVRHATGEPAPPAP
jgi:ferredoxin